MYFNGTITINDNEIDFFFCNSRNEPCFSWDCNNRNGSQYVTSDINRINELFDALMEIKENSKFERDLDIEITNLGLY